jgi:hypothetical protein
MTSERSWFNELALAVYVCLALYFVGYCTGCQDVADDPCDPDTGEQCDDGRVPDEARKQAEPYKPVASSEQALVKGLAPVQFPYAVFSSPAIRSHDVNWDGTAGGMHAFQCNPSLVKRGQCVQVMATSFVARTLPGYWACNRPQVTDIACQSSRYGYRRFSCPPAFYAAPMAYQMRRAGPVFYDFDKRYVVEPSWPATYPLRIEAFQQSDGNTGLRCHYSGYKAFKVAIR